MMKVTGGDGAWPRVPRSRFAGRLTVVLSVLVADRSSAQQGVTVLCARHGDSEGAAVAPQLEQR